MGMVKMEEPTETSMPSMIAMVRGIFSVVVIPLPGSLVMTTVPPTSSTFRLTTSHANAAAGILRHLRVGGEAWGHQKVENIPVGIFHVRQSDAVSDALLSTAS